MEYALAIVPRGTIERLIPVGLTWYYDCMVFSNCSTWNNWLLSVIYYLFHVEHPVMIGGVMFHVEHHQCVRDE